MSGLPPAPDQALVSLSLSSVRRNVAYLIVEYADPRVTTGKAYEGRLPNLQKLLLQYPGTKHRLGMLIKEASN